MKKLLLVIILILLFSTVFLSIKNYQMSSKFVTISQLNSDVTSGGLSFFQ